MCRLGQVATPTLARSVAQVDADRHAAIKAAVHDGAGVFAARDAVGTVSSDDHARAGQCAAIVESIHGPIDLSVVVNGSNGMGSVTVDVSRDLGSTVETLNAEVDGRFPSAPSELTAEHCASLCVHVAATDAALEIAHDGDADRMLGVDETGRFVGGDELLALFATDAIGRTEGIRVAVSVDTSLLVADAVTEAGGQVERTKVGDVFVVGAAQHADIAFRGEPSGAWIWPDDTLCPDGPLAACRLSSIVADQGAISTFLGRFDSYPVRRMSVETDAKTVVMDAVTEPSTKDEKYAAVLSFAANKQCDGKVSVSPAEIRGCTGVSRRYAYDLVEAIATDIDGVGIHELTQVQTGSGLVRLPVR
jgi:phosphoglucosamine mutase